VTLRAGRLRSIRLGAIRARGARLRVTARLPGARRPLSRTVTLRR
jgi:hypothetical protein